MTLIGLTLVMFATAIALLGPILSQHDPNAVAPASRLQGPSLEHPLGTDQFGRDILSRIIAGAGVSLSIALTSVSLALSIGVTLGVMAGYVGGLVDDVIMRVVDVIMAFPYVVLAIALAAALGPSPRNVIMIIAVIRVPLFARVTRGVVLAVKEFDYVAASRSMGARPWRIILRHVLPNSLTSVVVIAFLSIAAAINTEAAISFLGLGIRPPQASWGNMLADAQNYVLTVPSLGIAPGVMISLTVLGFQLLGDGLRDWLDPRQRGR